MGVKVDVQDSAGQGQRISAGGAQVAGCMLHSCFYTGAGTGFLLCTEGVG